MARKITKLSIFLSSPSGLDIERTEIHQVIDELNMTYGKTNDINFDLLKWETHSAPGISKEYTQQLINEDIGNDYDIFLGILWNKFGTKTKIADSGTEEEFHHALKRFESGENIQILFYFKSEPIPFDKIDPEQISKINKFKEYLREKKVLYWNFNNTEELKNQLRLHIPKRTDNLLNNSPNINNKEIEINNISDINETEEIGILDFIIDFGDYMANANLALTNIGEATNVIGEEFKNKTTELEKLKKLPNFNSNLLASILTKTAKSIDNYTNRIELEGPLFQENFESAIKIGSGYLNTINKESLPNNIEELQSLLESIKILKFNIPSTMSSLEGFYYEIKSLPNLYSIFTKSKNKLLKQLDILQSILKNSYNLTHEFEGELDYKLNLHISENENL